LEGLAEQAFRQHYAQIYRYLRRKTRDRDEAEELTQEVFADAAVTLSRMSSPPTSMLALLYSIAGRRFADHARHESHAAHPVPLEEAPDDPMPAEYGIEIGRAIREAIARLPAEQRVVVCMRLIEGCSFQEIARVAGAGATEASIKMRFRRGLEVLRLDLKERGIEPEI
jgi:RNA polymerase sigma-70 factor (ECF subfamily)